MLELEKFMGKEVKYIGNDVYVVVNPEFVLDDDISDYIENNFLCADTVEQVDGENSKVLFVFGKSCFEKSIQTIDNYLASNNLGVLEDYILHGRIGLPNIGGIYGLLR